MTQCHRLFLCVLGGRRHVIHAAEVVDGLPVREDVLRAAYPCVSARYGVKRCFYGHLHGASHKRALEGMHYGTDFSLVAGDRLDFVPKKICE